MISRLGDWLVDIVAGVLLVGVMSAALIFTATTSYEQGRQDGLQFGRKQPAKVERTKAIDEQWAEREQLEEDTP